MFSLCSPIRFMIGVAVCRHFLKEINSASSVRMAESVCNFDVQVSGHPANYYVYLNSLCLDPDCHKNLHCITTPIMYWLVTPTFLCSLFGLGMAPF